MKTLEKPMLYCLVCGRASAKQTQLPSGRVADLDDSCAASRFCVAEAERRVLRREIEQIAGEFKS